MKRLSATSERLKRVRTEEVVEDGVARVGLGNRVVCVDDAQLGRVFERVHVEAEHVQHAAERLRTTTTQTD